MAFIQLKTAHLAANGRAYWQVEGPPCATATAAQLEEIGRPLSQEFKFETLTFARISGAATCSGVTETAWFQPPRHYDVCQFSRPRAVTVEAGGRTFAYAFHHAERATIFASADGRARCVAAAHFNGD